MECDGDHFRPVVKPWDPCIAQPAAGDHGRIPQLERAGVIVGKQGAVIGKYAADEGETDNPAVNMAG